MGVLHPRLRLTLMALSLIALVAILVFVLVWSPKPAAPLTGGGFAGSIRPAGPPRDFTLRDEEGRTVALSALRGTPVVLSFMYTTCQDDCPTMTQQIRGALDGLGRDVPALAVSVDPANDTPRRAQRFLTRQRMTGRMRFLLGDEATLQRVWRAYGVQPQERGLEHSASVLLLDRRGVARVSFPIGQLTPEGLEHDLRILLAERE